MLELGLELGLVKELTGLRSLCARCVTNEQWTRHKWFPPSFTSVALTVYVVVGCTL